MDIPGFVSEKWYFRPSFPPNSHQQTPEPVPTLTGQLLSIEAKSRYRQGVLGVPGTPETKTNFRLGPLINSAVAKQAKHRLVIFVDTNLPFKWAEKILGRQGGNGFSRPMVALLDRVGAQHNDTDPIR